MNHKFSKTVKPLLLLLILITTTISCIKQQDDLIPDKGKFFINYSFDNPQTMGIPALINEQVLNDACLIFYKEDGSYVTHSTTEVYSGSGSFPITIPDEIITGERYHVLVVGNYNHFPAAGQSIDDYIRANASKSYMLMREVMFSQSPASARMSTPLPFSGVLLGADGQESLFTGPTADARYLDVSVKFSRTVARFNLRNMVAGKLKIEWVKVCNYRNKGYFFHNDAPAGNGVIRGTANSAPQKPYPKGYVTAPSASGGKQNFTSGGLYAYPNIVSYVTQNDELTTFLMIAGYYQKTGEPINTTKLTYYRANIALNEMSQVLKRNYIYTMVINDVKSEGSENEDGAMAEDSSLLDYVVVDDWEDNSGNTVVDDNGNYLTISRTNVILNSPAGESAVIKVAVKPGAVWNVAWLHNLEGVFKTERIDNNSFRIISTGVNDASFVKNGLLNVTVDGTALAMEIDVMQLSSQYVISVFPNYNNVHPLIIEGFSSTPSNINGLVSSKLFMVTLTNPAQYTFKVESSFNKNADAYLSLNTPTVTTSSYRENSVTKNLLTGGMNENIFYLHVFRTGPGDPVIRGNIKVTAIPAVDSGLPEQSLSFPVEIHTSCDIGDIKLGTLTVSDRNAGTMSKTIVSAAPNYTNDPLHPDNGNTDFKGLYSRFAQYDNLGICRDHGTNNYIGADAVGWLRPTIHEIDVICKYMVISKERVFATSDTKTADNRAIGCYFPLSGQKEEPNKIAGFFWSSMKHEVLPGSGIFSYPYAYMYPDNIGAEGSLDGKGEYSIRCVKQTK